MLTTIFCFTGKGSRLGKKLLKVLPGAGGYSRYDYGDGLLPIEDDLNGIVGKAFHESETIIFIGAAGIAVRLIAPYITSKDKDPAVIVIDENASFIIPILSGHLGGANQTAIMLSKEIGGQAVITTATDINHLFAVDVWAKEQGLFIHNIGNIKYISSALLKGDKIGFTCDYKVETELPEFLTGDGVKAGIVISENLSKAPYKHTLHLTPRSYIVGIGCRKNVDISALEETVLNSLRSLGISQAFMMSVATIDIKADEPAIKAFCDKYKLKLSLYSSEELNRAEGEFTTSDFVKSTVGVDNVCERAAFLAGEGGEILQRKTSSNGVTAAIVKKEWRCRF